MRKNIVGIASELCPNQPDFFETFAFDSVSGRVTDVQDWKVDLLRHLRIGFVLRVGAEQDGLRSRAAELLRCIRQYGRDFVPSILVLELLDTVVVEVIDDQWGIRIVPVGVVDSFVDVAVVVHG